MNYLDIIIAIPLLWGAFKGFKNGLIIEAASLVALGLGVWGAVNFSSYMAGILDRNLNLDPHWVEIIAFALTFTGIVILVHLLAKLIDKLLKAVALGIVVRIAGIAFGAAKFALVLSFIILVIDGLNNRLNFVDPVLISESLLYIPLLELSNSVKEYFSL